MGVLSILLLVFFVIVAILLILLDLIQNEEGDSLGGIFAGGSSSAFGSRSGNVLTRATTLLGAVFLVLSLGLALINRSPGASGVEAAGRQLSPELSGDWWQEEGAVAPEGSSSLEMDLETETGLDVEPETGAETEPETAAEPGLETEPETNAE
jgi:preprotein translocase subunit SecG